MLKLHENTRQTRTFAAYLKTESFTHSNGMCWVFFKYNIVIVYIHIYIWTSSKILEIIKKVKKLHKETPQSLVKPLYQQKEVFLNNS